MTVVSAASGTGAGSWRLLKRSDGEDEDEEGGAGEEKPADEAGDDPPCEVLDPSCRHSRGVTLAVLVMVFIANQACRALPFYLVNFSDRADSDGAMNVALHFGSGRYGFLATLGFTMPFTLGSLVAGVVADKADRMHISGLAGLMWSFCTLCMAGAASYPVVLLLRILLGLSQSITNPAALSLIADLFPQARATMSSVFGLGIYLGTGIASLGLALDEHLGWRDCSAIFGLVSMALSLLAFVPADRRRPPPAHEPGGGSAAHSGGGTVSGAGAGAGAGRGLLGTAGMLRDMLKGMPDALGAVFTRTAEALASKAARWLLLASGLRFCAGFGILVWLPSAMQSRFPDHTKQFSVCNSLIKAVAGGVSSVAGGLTSDMLHRRGFGDRAGAMFSAASSLVSAPLWYMVLDTEHSFEVSMGFLLAEYLTAESWLGPAVATLQGAVPADRRGAAQGVFSSLTALGNALPAALGLLAAEDLAPGLQVSVAVCYVLSAMCFSMAALSLPGNPEDVEPVQSQSE
uniref:Major facilitator superfamily (MFS) profile domain-containing protein n=1 Tax=Pyrodinium bahamense TaxID=73915 RepID=A0A7S0AF22_9DINO